MATSNCLFLLGVFLIACLLIELAYTTYIKTYA
nr:MAG TPA: hypothetical protein [Caudoviricetes sp.]DAQ58610.1 MAG TPA: hypothetical protein [Caudoviricetes sp.]